MRSGNGASGVLDGVTEMQTEVERGDGLWVFAREAAGRSLRVLKHGGDKNNAREVCARALSGGAGGAP